jgi:hypothetical protein
MKGVPVAPEYKHRFVNRTSFEPNSGEKIEHACLSSEEPPGSKNKKIATTRNVILCIQGFQENISAPLYRGGQAFVVVFTKSVAGGENVKLL